MPISFSSQSNPNENAFTADTSSGAFNVSQNFADLFGSPTLNFGGGGGSSSFFGSDPLNYSTFSSSLDQTQTSKAETSPTLAASLGLGIAGGSGSGGTATATSARGSEVMENIRGALSGENKSGSYVLLAILTLSIIGIFLFFRKKLK